MRHYARNTSEVTYKVQGEQKISSSPLVFTYHCSNKLIRLMTAEDKILKDVKKAVEEQRPLDRFEAYLKTSNGIFM